ncbi:hypothetical protein [Pedobacter cryoconitis]|uniref:Uncharacterized protein n=1 Tax=Pedobacter cryoconitis TaxID=188932 RepID=A0A7X0J1C7_9SPHI|nr:hypothetical protein [Pedobacter cryoconitis]MBB6499125.1 hypothetical protein [Pedobacter cryoconitis]
MKDLILKNNEKKQANNTVRASVLKQVKREAADKPLQVAEKETGSSVPEVYDLLEAEDIAGSLTEARRYFESDRARVKESRFTEENTLMEEGFEDWFF